MRDVHQFTGQFLVGGNHHPVLGADTKRRSSIGNRVKCIFNLKKFSCSRKCCERKAIRWVSHGLVWMLLLLLECRVSRRLWIFRLGLVLFCPWRWLFDYIDYDFGNKMKQAESRRIIIGSEVGNFAETKQTSIQNWVLQESNHEWKSHWIGAVDSHYNYHEHTWSFKQPFES